MRRLVYSAPLFLALALVLMSQSTGPPIGFTPVGTSPAGNACSNTSVTLVTPGGTIYTCQGGVYAAAGGSGGTPLPPASGGVGAMTSAPFWLRFLGDGSEGAETVTSGTAVVNDEHWFSSISVSAGATLAISSSGDPLTLRATGTCTIAGTISVSPNSDSGAAGISAGANYGGGGGGGSGGTGAGAAGGGGSFGGGGSAGGASGGNGGNGISITARLTKPAVSNGLPFVYSTASSSSYGGGGGGAGGSSGGAGGKGGQTLVLVCNTINFTGTLDASGANGGNSTGNNVGAGGGGGGGLVLMSAVTYSANTGTINVGGGNGGSCGAFTNCGTAGNGASGTSYTLTMQ